MEKTTNVPAGASKARTSSGALSATTKGSKARFLTKYNPSCQYDVARGKDEALFGGGYPTLRQARETYGKGTDEAWLVAQLTELAEYCNAREELLDGPHLEACAKIIATEFDYLPVSALMLFFFEFKAGKWGRFYGRDVSPMDITTHLYEFHRHDYNLLLAEHERKIERERLEAVRRNYLQSVLSKSR